MCADIVLLALPWFWIVVATIIAVRHRHGPASATWLAVALAAYGVSTLFIGVRPIPPWWLVAWQLLAATGALAAAWAARRRKPSM